MGRTQADPRSAEMKREMANHFDGFEHEYRDDSDTNAEVVFEDSEVVVVADHTGHELNEWASEFDVSRSELSEFFHSAARDLCDYDWSVSDPVLFNKSEGE